MWTLISYWLGQYLSLDTDHNGMLNKLELSRLENCTSEGAVLQDYVWVILKIIALATAYKIQYSY